MMAFNQYYDPLDYSEYGQVNLMSVLQQISSSLYSCKLLSVQFLYLSDDKTYNVFNYVLLHKSVFLVDLFFNFIFNL